MTEMLRSGSVMTRAAMGRTHTTAFGLFCFAFVAALATRFASEPPGFRHLTEPASDKFGKILGSPISTPLRMGIGHAPTGRPSQTAMRGSILGSSTTSSKLKNLQIFPLFAILRHLPWRLPTMSWPLSRL